jgi:hypothetical protein
MAFTQVVSSALSLARELWRYGEPELAERALRLPAGRVLAIGARVEPLHRSGDAQRIWPDGPKDRALLLAAVEELEGRPRPCARRIRLPERRLPEELQATEEQRWQANREVMAVLDAQLRARGPDDVFTELPGGR